MPIIFAILFCVGLGLTPPKYLPPFLQIFQHGLRNTLIILKPFLIIALIIFIGGALLITYEDWQKKKRSIADYEVSQQRFKEEEKEIPEYGSSEYHSWSYMHADKAAEYERKLNGQDSTGNYILNPHPVNSSEAQAWKADSTAFKMKKMEQKQRDQFVAAVDSLAQIKE